MVDIVLKRLEPSIHDRLRARAARNRRSMAEELRQIVREAVSGRGPRAEFKKLAAEVRALSADRPQTPSEQILRTERDAR